MLPPAWTAALARFREHTAHARSANTADTYERGVRLFLQWLAPRTFALSLPPRTLQEFAISLLRSGMALSSAKTYVAGIRKFGSWLEAQGSKVPVFATVDWPRENQIQPEVLPPNVLALYFAWVKANAAEPYRTAMLMLPHCGLRITELVSLRMENVQMSDKGLVLTVLGKGHKWRKVPVLRSFLPVLSAYMRTWRSTEKRARSLWVFPAQGKVAVSMDRRSLTSKLTSASRALGHPFSAHTMRRQYATALHKAGVPFETIAKILGHNDPKTTSNHYLALSGADLVDATRKVRL